MKHLTVLVVVAISVTVTFGAECNSTVCQLPDCLCASSNPPANLNSSEIPQLVLLTFNDAVNVQNINYYTQLFDNRTNPDNCPVSTTYFVSHEYTDYSYVNRLWRRGHEIGLHSITRRVPTTYWQTLSVVGHEREFKDQIGLIQKFANIPSSDIKGIRLPYLQLSGNNSFEMIKNSNLKYDCSWPTQTYMNSGLFPYTLDYISPQDCPIGPCPTAPIPGVWVVPMVYWRDAGGFPCATIDGCYYMPVNEDDIVNLMKTNFYRHYNGTRSPFGFHVRASWFADPKYFNAYVKFLDFLKGLNDVYMVSVQKALEWVQNPKSLNSLGNNWSCTASRSSTCSATSCTLTKEGTEVRYMTTCEGVCPNVYPWLGNPLGQ